MQFTENTFREFYNALPPEARGRYDYEDLRKLLELEQSPRTATEYVKEKLSNAQPLFIV